MSKRADAAWDKVDVLLRQHVRGTLMQHLLRKRPVLLIEHIWQVITDARTVEALERPAAAVSEIEQSVVEAAVRRGHVEALHWVADLLSGTPEMQRAVREVAEGVERGQGLPPRA